MSKEEWLRVATEKVAAAQAVLQAEVTALRSGEDWRSYLEFSAKLHAYSPNNTILLHVQHLRAFEEGRVDTPTPTFIGGYRTWQALGRQVDKGQKGYAILAPVRYQRREAVDATGTARPLGKGETPSTVKFSADSRSNTSSRPSRPRATRSRTHRRRSCSKERPRRALARLSWRWLRRGGSRSIWQSTHGT